MHVQVHAHVCASCACACRVWSTRVWGFVTFCTVACTAKRQERLDCWSKEGQRGEMIRSERQAHIPHARMRHAFGPPPQEFSRAQNGSRRKPCEQRGGRGGSAGGVESGREGRRRREGWGGRGAGSGAEGGGLGPARTDLKQRRSVRWPKGKYEAPLQASAPSLCALRNPGRGGEGGRRVLPEYGVRRRLCGGPQATNTHLSP